MDIVAYAKNIGLVLATASTLAYVSGYLALRARALVLGTDPAFTLVDEAYVMAGFRFVFITLIILLLLSPVILAVRTGASWLYEQLPDSLLDTAQWLLLALLALVTLFLMLKILTVNGILLQQKISEPNSIVQEAVMGGGWAIVFMFSITLMTVLSILWLKMRLSADTEPFVWVLGIVVVIQLFLLPIFHGALYAERKVRILGATPKVVQGLKQPLGIVDRSSEHVTLLGLDANSQRNLATIKIDELNGIPVKKIVSLWEFVEIELASGGGKGGAVMPDMSHTKDTPSTIETDNKGIIEVLINYLQITFEAIGSLGDSVVDYGQIWSVELNASGEPSNPRQMSAASNLTWPVLGSKDQTIYAIQKDKVVKLSGDGHEVTVYDEQKQWTKLLGVTVDGALLGLVYEDDKNKLALLNTDKTITVHTPSSSDKAQKDNLTLMQENRSYTGKRSLMVERSTRGGRGFDIFFHNGEKVINLSDCGDDRCGQPSLSPDFRHALYVREPRY